jgi:NADH-quinone oxidoreductase subunit L
MTRMMLYTFHGSNRTGAEAATQLHEAPWVMTGPLVVLAVLSLFGGLLNLPHVLPGAGLLEHWLDPVMEGANPYLIETHLSVGAEWLLMGLATVIAALGIAGAWYLLKPATLTTAKDAPAETGVQRVLLNKYYVDELYDALIVRPTDWVSRKVLWRVVDEGAIDGVAVNGAAKLSRLFGWLGTQFQTGNLTTYVVLFVVGALFLLGAVRG